VLMGVASARALERDRDAAVLGVFIAVGSLLRPEVYLAMPVYVLAALSVRVPVRRIAISVGMFAALVLPWLIFAKLELGSFLPNTAGAKSGGMILGPVEFARKLSPVIKIVGSSQLLTVIAIPIAALLSRGQSLMDRRLRFSILWVVALPVAYVVFDIQILSRYLLLITPFVCVLGMISFERIWERVAPSRAVAAMWLVAIVMILGNGAFYLRVVLPPSRAFSYDLTHNLSSLAGYLNSKSDPDAVVAAADIGYLAFYSQRRVLDLGGLVEPETGHLRSEHSYEEIVDDGLYFDVPGYPHVDYFVDRVHEPNRFDGQTLAGHRFESIFVTTVRNLGIRKPGPYYYTLYRLQVDEPSGDKTP